MKKTTITMIVLMACAAVWVCGCAMFNKGTLHYNRTTTIGQELMDLKSAKDQGAITDKEYEGLKKEVMEGGPIKPTMGGE